MPKKTKIGFEPIPYSIQQQRIALFEVEKVWSLRVYENKAVLESYAKTIYGGNCADAEDLVSDTIENALRKKDKFKEGNLQGWLVTILRNLHLNHYRRKQRRPEDNYDDLSFFKTKTTENSADAIFCNDDFVKVFDNLDEAQKSVMLLAMDRMKTRDIAKQLGMTAAKVRDNLKSGRSLLKRGLNAYTGLNDV